MRTYCFRCGVCGKKAEGRDPDPTMYTCQACGCGPLVRDYAAESAGVNRGALWTSSSRAAPRKRKR